MPMSKKAFGQLLEARGLVRDKDGHGNRFWDGIELDTAGEAAGLEHISQALVQARGWIGAAGWRPEQGGAHQHERHALPE